MTNLGLSIYSWKVIDVLSPFSHGESPAISRLTNGDET